MFLSLSLSKKHLLKAYGFEFVFTVFFVLTISHRVRRQNRDIRNMSCVCWNLSVSPPLRIEHSQSQTSAFLLRQNEGCPVCWWGPLWHGTVQPWKSPQWSQPLAAVQPSPTVTVRGGNSMTLMLATLTQCLPMLNSTTTNPATLR